MEHSQLSQLVKLLKIGYILAAILDFLIFLYSSSWFWFYKWIFMQKYTNIQELINFHKASSQIARVLRKIACLPSGGHLEFFILSKIYTKIIILVITYDIIQSRDKKNKFIPEYLKNDEIFAFLNFRGRGTFKPSSEKSIHDMKLKIVSN